MLQHKFVEFIPEKIEDGILYISIGYCTAIHNCVCGCGNEVVTPLSPTDWKLTFDGKTVSLYPSIGNWSFECQSHYWIKKNRIEFADGWSRKKILSGRKSDIKAKKEYYSSGREDKAVAAVKTDNSWRRFF
jgi:hypothetical protein